MANNENVNKVSYNNSVLIDLTEDTITPEVVVSGYTAHDRSGASISGTFVPVTGVKGNAESSYRTGNVNLTPENIGAIAKSGDTVTGIITYKDTLIDASKANNNVTNTQYPTTFNITDSANRILTRKEAAIYADGRIDAYWYVRNYDTSGTKVGQKGIRMSMDKSGVLTYTFSDPDKARIALGVKAIQTDVSSPVASGTAVAFIDTISQNSQGVITSTKKTVTSATTSAAGLMPADDKAKLDSIAIATLAEVKSYLGIS